MKIIINGPQGSGKSTQADLVAKKLGLPHINMGRLLRQEVEKQTEIGKKIKGVMKKGELLPSDIVNQIAKERLEKPDCANGFVIDGYPRELEEAEFLDSIADLDFAIFLEISDEIGVKRLSARRLCTGIKEAIYGLPEEVGEKCKELGGKLVQREDDKPEAVKKRLNLYHEVTEPLKEYFRAKDIFHEVDGSKSIDETFKDICLIVGK